MNNVTSIIHEEGKASQIFAYIKAISKLKGDVTLGELAKEIESCGNA